MQYDVDVIVRRAGAIGVFYPQRFRVINGPIFDPDIPPVEFHRLIRDAWLTEFGPYWELYGIKQWAKV